MCRYKRYVEYRLRITELNQNQLLVLLPANDMIVLTTIVVIILYSLNPLVSVKQLILFNGLNICKSLLSKTIGTHTWCSKFYVCI